MEKIAALDSFIALTKPYKAMWQSLEAKVCAIKNNNEYYLLSLRIVLTANKNGDYISLVEQEALEVAMWIQNLPIDTLPKLLADLRGQPGITLGNRYLRLDYYHSSTFWNCEKLLSNQRGYFPLDYPYVILETGASSTEKIDWGSLEKQLNHYGYSSLYSTSLENLGFAVSNSNNLQIIMAALIFTKIKHISIESQQLKISVEVYESVNIGELSLSYEIRYWNNENKPLNGSSFFNENEIVRSGNSFKLLTKIIGGEARIADARVWLYDKRSGAPVDTAWVHEEFPQKQSTTWRVLSPLLEERRGIELFDGHTELRRYLELDYVDASLGKYFELAVSFLLTALGFQVLFLGQPLHKKGIDVIAVDPDTSSVLLVSVHVSNAIGEKIRTLLTETNRLKSALKDVQLIPLIVTPIKIDDIINTDRADATTHGISLILGDQISVLYELASKFPQAETRSRSLKIISDSLGNQRLSVHKDE